MTEQDKELMKRMLEDYLLTTFGRDSLHCSGKLLDLAQYMLEANKSFNITAITNPADIVNKHLIDSIAPLSVLSIDKDARVIDIGSGGGFPGLPMKILREDILLTMMDSTAKKVGYISDVSGALGLDVRCVAARAEDAAHEEGFRERYDWVFARAVARLDVLCELCLPFVRIGGCFAAMKSGDCEEEAEQAAGAVSLLGGKKHKIIKYEASGMSRAVVLVNKVKNTSSKYPRQYAKIIKTPLK